MVAPCSPPRVYRAATGLLQLLGQSWPPSGRECPEQRSPRWAGRASRELCGVWAAVYSTLMQFYFLYQSQACDHFRKKRLENSEARYRWPQAHGSPGEAVVRGLAGCAPPPPPRAAGGHLLPLQKSPAACGLGRADDGGLRCRAGPQGVPKCACSDFTGPIQSQVWPWGRGSTWKRWRLPAGSS